MMAGSREYSEGEKYCGKRFECLEFDCFEQVRVLLFRERFGQERRLLFDSKCVRKKETNSTSEKKTRHNWRMKENSIENSFKLNSVPESDIIYEWKKPSSDEQMLREMIFGSVSTSYQGTSIKVHVIRSPLQIMISLVFPAPHMATSCFGGSELEDSSNYGSCKYEMMTCKQREKSEVQCAHSVPVNVPSRPTELHSGENFTDSGSLQSHDGYISLPNYELSDDQSSPLLHSGSCNSLQRRLQRNKATSIELGFHEPDEDIQGGRKVHQAHGEHRIKLGLSVVISLNEKNKEDERLFQDFLFTHVTLIEAHVMDLKHAAIKAYLNRKSFIRFMYDGATKLQCALQDLYTAPRLQFPEWLTIVSSSTHHDLSNVFEEKLCRLLKDYDKKETNFFVSTLLTAVLTHHLAWVPTVIPTEGEVNCCRSSHKSVPHWVSILAKSRPYNPLWVQLGDLYGALTQPVKLVKTVVKGSKPDVILQFLKVLSYFIRCSEIREQILEKADMTAQNLFPATNEESESYGVVSDITELKLDNQSKMKSNCCIGNHSCQPSIHMLDFSRTKELHENVLEREKSNCKHLPFGSTKCIVEISKSQCCCCTAFICTNSEYSSDPCIMCSRLRDSSKSYSKNVLDSLGYESMDEQLKLPKQLNSNNNFLSHGDAIVPDDKKGCEYLFEGKNGTALVCTNCNCRTVRFQDGISDLECNLNLSSSVSVKQPGKAFSENSAIMCSHPMSVGSQELTKQVKHECNFNKSTCNKQNGNSYQESLACILLKISDKQLEAIEEGYHSMEEAHNCRSERAHGSEKLFSSDNWSPDGLLELPLPQCCYSTEPSDPTLCKSFGWSLMAGVTEHYLKDFCLQGVCGLVSEEDIHSDLSRQTQVHVLGEPISEAICILADTDSWCVKILSSDRVEDDKLTFNDYHVGMSSLVSNICESVLSMHELGVPSESCIIHLEDKLQELYFHSSTFSDYVRNCEIPTTTEKVAAALNLDISDIPLLMAIASIHSSCTNICK